MHIFRPTVPVAILVSLSMALLIIACGGSAPEPPVPPAATAVPAAATTSALGAPTETRAPQAAETAAPTVAPTAAPTVEAAATVDPAPVTMAPAAPPTAEPVAADGAADGATVFELGEGTIARYRVEEELARTGFFVAVGETRDVAGSIAFDAAGAVVPDASRIAVQAATLTTDSNRRDGYVRNRTLETDTYPEVVFQPTAIDGLPASLADASGPVEFTITGDLTVKDQTREVTWDAMADFAGDGTASGMASVEFTFDDFGMAKPSVAVVLSVDDTIRLELDFVGTITGP